MTLIPFSMIKIILTKHEITIYNIPLWVIIKYFCISACVNAVYVSVDSV